MINTTYVRNMAFRCANEPEVVAVLKTCAEELDSLYEQKKNEIAVSSCRVVVFVDERDVIVSVVDKQTGVVVPIDVSVKRF
jgi:hypothetical protein